MKKLDSINARLEEILDELEAIKDLSKDNDLEQPQIDLANSLYKEFDDLHAERESLVAVQAKLDERIALRNLPDSNVEPAQHDTLEIAEARNVIPAQVKRQRTKFFDSPEDAFVSGMYLAALNGSPRAKEFMAAQTEGTDSEGGYTVPSPLSSALINLLESYGVARQKCKRIVMTADTLDVPKVLTHATIYYPGEAAAITESAVAFSQVNLVAVKLAALVKMSTEVAEDSIVSIMDTVVESIAYQVANEEDKNLFIGVAGGVNTSGIEGDANVDDTNVASVAALALTDFTACATGIGNPIIGARNEWYINPTLYHGKIRDLLDAAGGATRAELEGAQRPTLHGYPVNFVSVLPGNTATTSGDCLAVFGDLSLAAYFGDRRSLNFKTLNELYAANDQIGVVATERIDIEIANPELLAKITIT